MAEKYIGTTLGAPVVPGTTLDNFPTHHAEFGKGGWHEVADVATRDLIPNERLEQGMAVYVTGTSTLYILTTFDTTTSPVLKVWTAFTGGTTDYDDLTDKPSINQVTLEGDLSAEDLGVVPLSDYNALLAVIDDLEERVRALEGGGHDPEVIDDTDGHLVVNYLNLLSDDDNGNLVVDSVTVTDNDGHLVINGSSSHDITPEDINIVEYNDGNLVANEVNVIYDAQNEHVTLTN